MTYLICITIAMKIPAAALFRDIRGFLIFALLILIAATVAFPETETTAGRGIVFKDLLGGFEAAWRFICLVFLGVLFTAASSTREIRRGAESVLSVIPGVPANKAGFMVAATVSMLPLISDAVSETQDAQRARWSHKRKNPVVRIARLVIPILLRVFRMTNEMADAMQARGLDLGNPRPIRKRRLRLADGTALALTLCVCAAALVAARLV
jgi:energy-coupling factor transporter transmembrane protein EcfT